VNGLGITITVGHLGYHQFCKKAKEASMPSRLSERLAAARHSYFVGRASERALFQSALAYSDFSFNVVYIYGPGGIGKTALLGEFNLLCEQADIACLYLDARTLDPSPESFLEALQSNLEVPAEDSLFDFLGSYDGRLVILLDTYEVLAPLDEWILEEFLPQLPENTLFVLAGQQPPAAAWRADLGWQSIIRVLALRNLDSAESADYLVKRAVPENEHGPVLEFTHGHPLALSLVADLFAQRGQVEFSPEAAPDIVKTLLEQLVQKVPGPAHRTALEACSLVRVTTEALLAAMLMNQDVHELFEWLRGLSFMEFRPGGLFPHDLARDALAADLHWRNPDWYTELKRRARVYYTGRVAASTGQAQQRALIDLVYLHRDNPVVRPFFEWQTSGSGLAGAMRERDEAALLSMVKIHEGQEAAEIARHWLARQPEGVIVIRDSKAIPLGFMLILDFGAANARDIEFDPGARAAWDYLRGNAPLRPGERASFFRFWMSGDSYQGVSPTQSLIFIHVVRHNLITPRLAFSFIACAEAGFWAPVFAYADLERLPGVDFAVGGRSYGVYGHDWRVRPPADWLALMAEREISSASQESPAHPRPSEALLVLSQEAFGNHVRQALRDFAFPDHLRGSPLLRSRLVVSEKGFISDETQRVQRLRDLILQSAQSLQASPRAEKYYRALDRTYFHPAPTQEAAADLLSLPFSTYRRHLKAGIEHVIDALWQQEIGQK
jgi:hypothetical protein